MTWSEACADPHLRDLPSKIELNRWGQIVMSPAKNNRAFLRGKIAALLDRFLSAGQVAVEQPVETADGIKVPDVSWSSAARYERSLERDTADVAPEICVEVVSASNSPAELDEKCRLYFARGAQEIWLADAATRQVVFRGPDAELPRSRLCPGFPAVVPR